MQYNYIIPLFIKITYHRNNKTKTLTITLKDVHLVITLQTLNHYKLIERPVTNNYFIKLLYSLIDKSRDWDGKSAYISENELFMSQDLTENEIVIRQINCSKIVDRLLRQSLLN